MQTFTKVVLGYYLILNLLLLVVMWWDKRTAVRDRRRVPESTLFILSLLGGAVGGFLGMRLCHHKTRKPAFYIIFALSLVLHVVFLLFLFRR